MDDAVRQCGLAVVDMGDDGKVADVLHQGSGWPRKKVITGRRQNSPAIKKGHTVCPLMAWPPGRTYIRYLQILVQDGHFSEF
jgi:hypothetical protein